MGLGIYIRVSHKSQDLAGQERELERWAKGQDESVEWFRDKFTGTSMDRPGFNRLMEGIRSGRITTVCVWRLDRLGRTTAGLASLFDELTARKVNLVSIREGLDLKTPAGRLLADVIASVSRYENEVRRERQLLGIAKAKEAGVRFGRMPGTVKGRRLKVTSEAEQVIYQMGAEGKAIAAIARTTGLSRPTIYSVLGVPVMQGDWASYIERIRGLLQGGRPAITHTIERVIQESGTTDKRVRESGFWRYVEEGRRAYDTATKRGVICTGLVDENDEVVAVSFRLAGSGI